MIQEQGHVMFPVPLPDRCLGHRAGWGIVTAQCPGLALCQEQTQSSDPDLEPHLSLGLQQHYQEIHSFNLDRVLMMFKTGMRYSVKKKSIRLEICKNLWYVKRSWWCFWKTRIMGRVAPQGAPLKNQALSVIILIFNYSKWLFAHSIKSCLYSCCFDWLLSR